VSAAPERRLELESVFRAALAAVDAGALVRRALARRDGRLLLAGRALGAGVRVRLVAVGKAAAPMAAAFEECAGADLAGGLAVTRDGHGVPLSRVRLLEAGHPVPDERCERAARALLAEVQQAPPGDVLCVLLSGGASSLLACPAPGLALADLAATTELLLAAGADIEETNAVRKHLSAVAGGRLARSAAASRIEVLAISDVPGDRLDVIGSGPFAGDPTTFADALAVLRRLSLLERVPAAVRRELEAGARGERPETPAPGAPELARVHTQLLATNRTAVQAAAEASRRRGVETLVLDEPLAGEASEAGRALVARAARERGAAPRVLVAGGETVVHVRGPGRGGRSQELALAAALACAGGAPLALLAAGTDGSDGPTDAAGAYADEGTVARGRRAGVDAAAALERNDSHAFFCAEGGVLRTGPTGTNVMDLALVRVDPQ
jgi:glycerate-2-kinase